MGVTESHREPERDRERSSKSQREPVKAWESKLEPKKRLASHFLAYLNIVLLQNN